MEDIYEKYIEKDKILINRDIIFMDWKNLKSLKSFDVILINILIGIC